MITRKLPCLLTDEDLLDRGKQLANAEHDYGLVEAELKEAKADFKDQLDAIEERISELTTAIRDRVETRDVECSINNNFGTLQKEVIRSDTGEIVETYTMTEAERQGSLL